MGRRTINVKGLIEERVEGEMERLPGGQRDDPGAAREEVGAEEEADQEVEQQEERERRAVGLEHGVSEATFPSLPSSPSLTLE